MRSGNVRRRRHGGPVERRAIREPVARQLVGDGFGETRQIRTTLRQAPERLGGDAAHRQLLERARERARKPGPVGNRPEVREDALGGEAMHRAGRDGEQGQLRHRDAAARGEVRRRQPRGEPGERGAHHAEPRARGAERAAHQVVAGFPPGRDHQRLRVGRERLEPLRRGGQAARDVGGHEQSRRPRRVHPSSHRSHHYRVPVGDGKAAGRRAPGHWLSGFTLLRLGRARRLAPACGDGDRRRARHARSPGGREPRVRPPRRRERATAGHPLRDPRERAAERRHRPLGEVGAGAHGDPLHHGRAAAAAPRPGGHHHPAAVRRRAGRLRERTASPPPAGTAAGGEPRAADSTRSCGHPSVAVALGVAADPSHRGALRSGGSGARGRRRRHGGAACFEWIDPPFRSGHWDPELVALAGGVDPLGRPGRRRGGRLGRGPRGDPEVLVIACCGFDLADAGRPADPARLPRFADLPAARGHEVYLVDGSAYFSRPGPRLVDSLELPARWYPELYVRRALPAGVARA